MGLWYELFWILNAHDESLNRIFSMWHLCLEFGIPDVMIVCNLPVHKWMNKISLISDKVTCIVTSICCCWINLIKNGMTCLIYGLNLVNYSSFTKTHKENRKWVLSIMFLKILPNQSLNSSFIIFVSWA